MRHLLEIDDLSVHELAHVLDLAEDPSPPQVLARKGAALVFEKPSLRTRSSTEMAVVQLGGPDQAATLEKEAESYGLEALERRTYGPDRAVVRLRRRG